MNTANPVNHVAPVNIVQIVRGEARRVALVDGARLRLLDTFGTVYAMALAAITRGERLVSIVEASASGEYLEYDAVYEGRSEARLLPAFDYPGDPARCLVSGT